MTNYSNQSRGRRRRRRRCISPLKVAILVLAILAVVFLIIFAVRKLKDNDNVLETLEPESELSQEVIVDGINIAGMGHTEAKQAILKKYKWNMRVRCDGGDPDVYDISNLVETSIDKTLDMIYASDYPEPSYTIMFDIDESRLAESMEAMKSLWNIEPKNGSISGYDKTTETFTYSDSVDGRSFDASAVESEIRSAVASKLFDKDIKTSLETVAAEFDEEEVKSLYKTIGYYKTNSTSNKDRNNNLRLACEAIDGTLLQVGEQFSFNLLTGNRTPEKGYKAAGAYQNGEVVQEPGGGVCQVASTLYNAMIFSGLTADERHAHTFAPTYVTPGEDATVSYDGYSGPDLKFTNTSDAAIVVRAKYDAQTVTCWIIGIPILPEGETISLKSWKNEGSETTPVPVYEEDLTLEPGTEEIVSEGDLGSTWTTNIIHQVDGQIVSEEFFHTSKYKGHSPKIKRNSTEIQMMYATDESGNIIYEEVEGETVPVTIPYVPSESEQTLETEPVEQGPAGPNQMPGPRQSAKHSDEEDPVPMNNSGMEIPGVQVVPTAPGA